MAGRAADCREDPFAFADLIGDTFAPDWGQEPHERGEVVDTPPPRSRIADVLGIGDPVAHPHLLRGDPERYLLREDVVGNPHFVAVRVGTERQQRGVLRLPAEAADAAIASGDIDNKRPRAR